MCLNIYTKDGVFDRPHDRYFSDDLIEGKIDNKYDFTFGEVHTQYETEDSDGHSHYYTLFHGTFACINCDHNFEKRITIRKDKGFIGKIFGVHKNRVEMDSSLFEKYFEVRGENPIEVMQVLTSDIMDYMIDFFENKYEFEITIDKNMIFFRFNTGKIFEPKLFGSSLDKTLLKNYYDLINFIIDFTKMFNKTINETFN